MRRPWKTVCFSLVMLSTGCTLLPWMSRGDKDPKPVLPTEVPTAGDLVDYLNRQAAKVSMIEAQDLEIDVKAQGQSPPSLSGKLFCQKPRNFHLTGKVFGNDEVLAGSNHEKFWFWIKRMEPEPYLFHCSYAEYAKGGVRMPFPFQPEWVVEALGMGEYDPSAAYRVEPKGNYFHLIQDTTLPGGQPVKKVVVFNAVRVQPPQPQVVGYFLQDQAGKVICSAKVVETRVDPKTFAVYPRRIELHWPMQQMQMTLTLDKVSINRTLPQELATRLFNMPAWTHVKTYDLARRTEGSPTSYVRPASGIAAQRR